MVSTDRIIPFEPVRLSLADLLGAEWAQAVCAGREFLTGEDGAMLRKLAHDSVDFFPEDFQKRLLGLLPQVGEAVRTPFSVSPQGATSAQFAANAKPVMAPVGGLGYYRLAENGRLYLITKSEHYHAPLGHAFPGYQLVSRAARLGVPNATHNNTRGAATRLLEEELVRAANGIAPGDSLGSVLESKEPDVLNRVLNLETGSLAVEAALKMVLARFYRSQPGMPTPKYEGRIPVVIVLGDDDANRTGNYHGTTMLTQMMRGMWPELYAGMERGLYRVCPIRPNHIGDLEAAFLRHDSGDTKVAGFFHEIVMMNYGGRLLTADFMRRAYDLCRQRDVPVVVDEIQTGIWAPSLFLYRDYGLRPSFVAVGKGFPGGEFCASRLLFTAPYDCLAQFGALVTNGQEELASIAYLVTMRWAQANADATRRIGEYYEQRVRELAGKNAKLITAVDGQRHLTTIAFQSLEIATGFAKSLLSRGLDISAQTYKADCPPVVLTKLPLIAGREVADLVVRRMEEALDEIAANTGKKG